MVKATVNHSRKNTINKRNDMRPNSLRLSVCAMFPPEEDSMFYSEIESFIDVVHPEQLSLAQFLEGREYLVDSYIKEFGISIEIAHEDDGSLSICLFGVENVEDFEDMYNKIVETFFEEAEKNNFEIEAQGITTQEVRCTDVREDAPTSLN